MTDSAARAVLVLPFLVSSVPAWRSAIRCSSCCPAYCSGKPRSGIEDSTVKALVADVDPRAQRATATAGSPLCKAPARYSVEWP